MGALYITIILICRVFQHLVNKKTSNAINDIDTMLRYSGMRQCFAAFLALVIVIIGGRSIKIDFMTVLLSLISGTMIVISMSCSLYAMKTGLISMVSLFGTAGLIIPCLAGVFLFDTSISPLQWVGFCIFLFAAYLMIVSSKSMIKGFSVKTLILLLGVMVSEGFTMLSQQMFMRYVPDGNVAVFSLLSFGIVGLVLLIIAPVFSVKKGEKERKPFPRNLIFYGAILAIVLLTINQLATLSTAIVPPIILFTFINGGSTIIAAIVAAIFYKEKLTFRTSLGITLGIISFIIIKIYS